MLITGVPEKRVAKIFAANRDICGWYVLRISQAVTFSQGEVDLDAAKTHVQRSLDCQKNTHKGRIFIQKERATGKRRITALGDVKVDKGTALPPESNADVSSTIVASMLPGSIACADGGQAIRSSVKKCEGVPLATANHSRKPHKQFTRLQVFKKPSVCPELEDV